jgi:hypothetical protein
MSEPTIPEDAARSRLASEQTIANATPMNEDEEKLLEEFHAALHGGMERDTLDNKGVPFTGEVLAESAKRCDALMDDPEFQAMLLKL